MEGFQHMVGKFAAYAPHFKGPMTPQESVSTLLKLFEKSSIGNGDGGAFISHLGTRQWI